MASQGDKITYFLVGGFVGATIALLFAPRSGEETRRLIEDKYREGSKKVGQTAQDGREYLEEKGELVTDAARASQEKLRDKSGHVVGMVAESLTKGKKALAKKKETISKAVKAGKKVYEEGKEERKEGAVEEGA